MNMKFLLQKGERKRISWEDSVKREETQQTFFLFQKQKHLEIFNGKMIQTDRKSPKTNDDIKRTNDINRE